VRGSHDDLPPGTIRRAHRRALHPPARRLASMKDDLRTHPTGPVAAALLTVPDGRVVRGNRQWSDLLIAVGRTPGDVDGRPWETWWFGDPGDRVTCAQVARASDPCVLRPFTTEHRGRRTVWDGLLVPVPSSDPPMALLTCVDVTDAALARERLEEQARAQNELLGHAGHELRGPLAPLATWAEVLRRMFERTARDAEWDRQAMRALSSFDRQLRVLTLRLEDLFAITRLERGVALERQTLEIGVLLEMLARAVRESAAAAELRVERELSAAGRVVVDPNWMARAVQSLAADMWARRPSAGGIVLRASSAGAAPRVARFEVSTGTAGPSVDPGARRPPALAFQLARRVAELHEGRAGAEGDESTRYWIEIPLAPE